jgi:hypothetical protein
MTEREELERLHGSCLAGGNDVDYDALYDNVPSILPRLLADLDAAESDRDRFAGDLALAEDESREMRDLAWTALGKPDGTYDTSNVQRLCEQFAEVKDELGTLRADRDAALLILPACCGSLADAADTMRQELADAKAKLAALVEVVDDIVTQGIDDGPGTPGYSVPFAIVMLLAALKAAGGES